MVFRAALRSRLRSWLALAGLVAITGGASLAALAAGRRTEAALPELVAATRSPDIIVVSGGPPDLGYAQVTPGQIRHLPGVVSMDAGASYLFASATVGGNTYGTSQNAVTLISLAGGPDGLAPALIAGREPNPHRADEVLADYGLERKVPGLSVGSTVRVSFYGPGQALASTQSAPGTGPVVTLHVVGIDIAGLSLPVGVGGLLQTTPAFARAEAPRTLSVNLQLLRVRPGGTTAAETALQQLPGVQPGFGNILVVSAGSAYRVVEHSLHPQVIGWWILAALAALGAVAVVAQGLARQAAAEAGALPTLSALGMGPAALLVYGMGRAVVVGVAGAAGAIAVAFALSPLTPVGVARVAEIAPGLAFDAPVLLLGGLAVLLMVTLAGALPAWRRARAPRGTHASEAGPARHPSGIAASVARSGGSPPAVIGTRWALERAPGPGGTPPGSALLGATLGISALVGAAVFGAGLTHLLATPALYGNDFSLATPGGGTRPPPGTDVIQLLRSDVATLPGVAQISIGGAGGGTSGSRPVSILGLESLRGPLTLSVVAGRAPAGPGEVALGASTMRELHTRVGATIPLAPVSATVSVRVVGEVALPAGFDSSNGGLGNGAAMVIPALIAAGCPPDQCDPRMAPTVFITFADSPAGRRGLARLEARAQDPADPLYYLQLQPASANPPTSLINFGNAVNFPALLGLMVIVFALATLAHVLVAGVSRRRGEVGTLKALGFVRRQAAAAVSWQSLAVLAFGLLAGVPLGVAAGRGAWILFAHGFGVVADVVVPWGQLALIAAGTLLAAELIAAGPALLAARFRTADLLREGLAEH